jgi:hypothetical protein
MDIFIVMENISHITNVALYISYKEDFKKSDNQSNIQNNELFFKGLKLFFQLNSLKYIKPFFSINLILSLLLKFKLFNVHFKDLFEDLY